MKKRALMAAAALAALLIPQVAGAEGFGIVQWSAAGTAMGGARMFAENDVSMVAANPASLTKFTGAGIGVNASYISPHGRYEVKHPMYDVTIERDRNRIHPGIVPGTYFVKQINEKNWVGIGAYTRYGMVSGFQPKTYAAMENLYAKMNGLSVTPVFAHKFDKKWSAAVGAEISYVGLEMNKDLYKLYGTGLMQLKGESYALGWNVSANYSFDEKNEMGVVYRSKVKHSLDADLNFYGLGSKEGSAYGVVTLPDQWSIGYNHKFDKKNRVELNATRTNWHTYDALNMTFSGLTGPASVQNGFHAQPRNYSDTWRYAIGYEHKFSEKYTGLLGFSFDDHAIPYNGGDFVVPTGLRRTYSIGMQYNDKRHTIAAAVGLEQIGDLTFKSQSLGSEVHTHNNYAKIFSVGYQYKF